MPDAIDNLAQALNQANAVDEFPGFPGLKMGDLVPGMAGVRIGDTDFYGTDAYGQEAPYNWRTGAFEFKAAPSDVGFGNIDYGIRDQPVDRINIGNTDEQDALIRTGIGTPLDPKTEDRYGFTGLVPPGDLGGTIGVVDANPSDFEGQIPSVPQGVVTRGEPVGRTFEDFTQRPDYSVPIGFDADTGDIVMSNRNNIRDTILVPSGRSISQADIDRGVSPNVTIPTNWNKGINTAPSTSQVTPTPVESYQSVGADEPTTTSLGGFDNTGGDVTVGPNIRGAGPGGSVNVTPGYVPKPEVKPGDEFKDSPYRIFDPTGKDDKLAPYTSPTGEVFPTDQNGYKWNYQTQQFDCVGGKCSEKNPVEDTPKPPVVTTPPTGGTKPPGGGGQPGGGTPGGGIPSGGGQPGRGPTIIPPREPVTPLVRRETVIPTKGTKEVPLPDRQADPFAKLYADLLANSQQQQDQYRYINYDPDQIMNAAMSGFRRRGAMRSLQGY